MPAHGGRGFYEYFEDFLVTAIGDLPEVDILSAAGVSTAILANQFGGVVEIPVATSDDNDAAAVTSNLNWSCDANGYLIGEWRVKWDTSVADMFWFLGFSDNIATGDELQFDSTTTDVYDIITPTDAFGFTFNNDATTKTIVAVAGKTNALTYQSILSSRFTPVVDVYHVFRVEMGPGAVACEWSIDGEVVARTARAAGDTTSYVDVTAPLCIGAWNNEQATANELEMDYMYARKGRRTGDAA